MFTYCIILSLLNWGLRFASFSTIIEIHIVSREAFISKLKKALHDSIIPAKENILLKQLISNFGNEYAYFRDFD